MLNPSTADGQQDDATVRKITKLSERWGYHGLTVVNLFALRETSPAKMFARATSGTDIVGPSNDDWIRKSVEQADLVMAAWGRYGVEQGRASAVVSLIRSVRPKVRLRVLGLNLDGSPKHPLYRKDTSQAFHWAAMEGPGDR